ncbi:family 4 glycosyl hydrolase [Alkaliphilus peptidifermentans]|uniref:Maltose-6'-phosphate glucosidase n=1 Tax=Alkaliphilus peptidifermentans DSM 18978 TaxID=1120976 RepID=A0A1G5ILZ7_9FIRM|nr:6-phospho-alpha-glucosidase [Alkaliphilus peptidifermentans]SCY77092.1 maltose-6'-phosphate glucosidase [Alkaliphilus peptidifermentans DSM 18978]
MNRKPLAVTIVGAGSTRTPALIGSLVNLKERFPLKKLVLFDIDKSRLDIQKDYIRLVMEEHYPGVELTFTVEEDEAYIGTDYVFVQMRVGGAPMRSYDEKIPLKHGLVGQETCGPGGFAYGMRSIRPMIHMVEKVRQWAPDAWILNYTNPAAIVSVALDKAFPDDKKILNICDQPYSMIKSFAKILDVDMYDLEPRYFGLNHFGWFTKLYNTKTGVDMLPQLKDYLTNHEFKPFNAEQRDPSWLETYKRVNKMLSYFPDHLPNTYLQYYFFPSEIVAESNPEFTRVDEAAIGREVKILDICKKAAEQNSLEGLPLLVGEVHGNMMVEVAESIAYDLNKVFVVMVKNKDIIPNLPADAMVETPGELGAKGAKGYVCGEVDVFYKALLEGQYAYERLTAEACLEENYGKALQALTINRTVVDPNKAKAILDDLMEVNKEYWILK